MLLHSAKKVESLTNTIVHTYSAQSQHFVLPQAADYDPGNASLAHSRSLVFLRKWLGGPLFNLEEIWDEHCYFEFEVRSVAKTMATMVVRDYFLRW
jgi:carboxymethylenebutenolidase